MHPAIARHQSEIAAICRRFGIRQLDVFGSAARGQDFDASRSDADFIVEFEPDAPPDLNGFFGVKLALEQVLGRGVDLVEQGAVRNPYVLSQIEGQRQNVYGA